MCALDHSPAEPPDSPEPSRLPFPVVGIGASAGCIAALRQFFEPMGPAPGMAFVVVVHLSPRHESNLAQILSHTARMPVLQVREAVRIELNRVYVISPAQQLAMTNGRLEVSELPDGSTRLAAIDSFFRTLGEAHRSRAIGVILSGTGSDGTLGLARIKECGGISLAQSPNDAEYDGMPASAISAGVVDFSLDASRMAAKLEALWENMQRIEIRVPGAPDGEPVLAVTDTEAAEAALRDTLKLLRAATGHDFRHYKRATVLRRIERRLQVTAVPGLPEYRAYLEAHPEETGGLLKDLLISVTNFFRDREAFEALALQLDALFANDDEVTKVRAWVAGCATGEEAYSIAMLLSERADDTRPERPVQVFASDIDENAIAVARAGVYPSTVLDDVTPARLRRFFQKEKDHVRIRKEVRERVLFAVHNLLRDPPFSNLDLICCRNLLIYLDRDVQKQVLEVFHFALKPGGLLFLGSSESTDIAADLFEPVDKKWRIYRSGTTPRRGRALPTLPLERSSLLLTLRAESREEAHGLADFHRRMRDAYAPPSVLIDEAGSVLHSTTRAAAFLRFVPGQPSSNLLDVVRPELRLELRTALFRAWQIRASVEAKKVHLEEGGEASWIAMTAHPVEEGGSAFMLVLFDSIAATLDDSTADTPSTDPVLLSLEEELRQTREQLRGSIGESAKSTEDLRATNEELQAINEELRSATEELETSKEELQSVNEELVTVNQELKLKVEETAKANDDLMNLIASTDIATVFVDRDLRVKRFTPRASQLFNLIASDVGRRLLDITHHLDYDKLEQDARDAFQLLRAVEREISGPEGRAFLVRVLPYRTHEDVIDGAVLNFIDISPVRQAERRLREGEANLRMVVESTEDYAIITTQPDGTIVTWNQGARRLFGYQDSEALGQSIELIYTPVDRSDGVAQREMAQARENGRASDERWHQRKDGSLFFCSGIMTPMYERADLVGYAKIARDLTDRKRAEAQMEALLTQETAMRAELQHASQLKDEFLAVMSHELKHPLNLIHVNAELLARLPEVRQSAAVARATDVIRRTVLGQAKIIDDLLDLSRARTGKLGLARSLVEWGAVIESALDAVADDAKAKDITLLSDIDPAASPISADPVRVEQIVWNLLSNALKFTPPGGQIQVRLSVDDAYARLDVIDNGQGISPEFLPQVFEMFRQASHGAARSEGGLGIGLALVKHLAEEHGGRVSVASQGVGRGASFSVWLPRSDRTVAALSGRAVVSPLDGLRVLVIDDSIQALESFTMLLQLEGAVVTAVSSGKAALEAASGTEAFDLVFSDVAMPGMDGYTLITALRAEPKIAHVPAIAMTGFGRGKDVRRALAAGFDAHLAKPIDMTDLLQRVKELTAGRARALDTPSGGSTESA